MKFPPVRTADYRRFLAQLGLVYKRVNGDHEIWDRPNASLLRPVSFIANDKEVLHYIQKQNLTTLRISGYELTDAEYIRRLRAA